MFEPIAPRSIPCALAALVAAAALLVPAVPVHAQATDLNEVVMYGIDADTNELLRYAFETDEFVRIGAVTSTDGTKAVDCENLAWVPSGPAKGMYTIPTKGGLRGWLMRINPLDGMAVQVKDTGWSHVIGMAAIQNPVTSEWTILTTDRDSDHVLFAIDPMTGNSVHLMDTQDDYEGLAVTPDGRVLGCTVDELWVIDPGAGTETKLGDLDYDKVEALEYAFGDGAPTIDATAAGVPAAWTAQGVLFGFDDDSNALMLMDPATGDAVDYNCAFSTVDCEGLIFTTKSKDPYGRVVADPCD
jgi:hypothetical protein